MNGLRVDDRVPYPDSTQDFVKILRQRGLEAAFGDDRGDRRYVTHKAFELWLPIIEFALEVLVALEAGVLADLLKDYLFEGKAGEESDEPSGPAIVHVDWRVTSSSGDERRIVADGSAGAVLEALDRFEREVREG